MLSLHVVWIVLALKHHSSASRRPLMGDVAVVTEAPNPNIFLFLSHWLQFMSMFARKDVVTGLCTHPRPPVIFSGSLDSAITAWTSTLEPISHLKWQKLASPVTCFPITNIETCGTILAVGMSNGWCTLSTPTRSASFDNSNSTHAMAHHSPTQHHTTPHKHTHTHTHTTTQRMFQKFITSSGLDGTVKARDITKTQTSILSSNAIRFLTPFAHSTVVSGGNDHTFVFGTFLSWQQ